MIKKFEEIIAWQKARELCKDIYVTLLSEIESSIEISG